MEMRKVLADRNHAIVHTRAIRGTGQVFHVSAVLIHQAHEEYFMFGQVLQEVQVIKQSGRVAFRSHP